MSIATSNQQSSENRALHRSKDRGHSNEAGFPSGFEGLCPGGICMSKGKGLGKTWCLEPNEGTRLIGRCRP